MEYPMRMYSLNLFERLLMGFLTLSSWLMFFYGAAVIIFKEIFYDQEILGATLIAATFLTAILKLLAAAGVRQNRTALACGSLLMFLTGTGWLVNGIGFGFSSKRVGSIVAGALMWLLLLIIRMLRKRGIEHRFNMRFVSFRYMETLIQAADALIDEYGHNQGNAVDLAVYADHKAAKMDKETQQKIKRALFKIKCLLPLRILRPFHFPALGTNERKRALNKVPKVIKILESLFS